MEEVLLLGVIWVLIVLILSTKYVRKASHCSCDNWVLWVGAGFVTESITLNSDLELWLFFVTMLEKYFTRASLTALWYSSIRDFRMSKETCKLSDFHFLSAFLQRLFKRRVSSFSQGVPVFWDLTVLRGAMWSRMAKEVLLK